jgi:hypothetical protein
VSKVTQPPLKVNAGGAADPPGKTTIRDESSGILRLLATFALIQVAALALVIAAEMVPDRMVADSLLEAIDRGWVTTTHHPTTGLDNRVDRWTECFALTMGLGDPPTSNNVQTAITNPQLGKCELSVPALIAYRDGAILESQFDYYRYWHGYTIVSRPSLALLGVAGARMLALTLAATAIVATSVAVARSTSIIAAVVLVIPIFLTSDLVDLGESLPHAIAAAASWGAALFAWLSIQRRQGWLQIATIGLVTGAVAAFFDLMVFIPGTLALISILIVVATWMHGWRGWQLLGAGALASVMWFLGFAITWATKWLIAGVVVGFGEVARTIRDQVSFRVSGEFTSVVDVFGEAARLNVDYWLERPLGFLIPVGLVVAVVLAARGLYRRLDPVYLVVVGGLAMVPLVWYEVLSSHSQIHFWITYKSLPLALGGLLFALVVVNTYVPMVASPQPDLRIP